MAVVLALLGVALGTMLLLGTLASFYHGTGEVTSHPEERSAVARVGECQRVGPLSVNGLGYWWHCQVSVTVEDGRQVDVVLDGSMVTPDDRGALVQLREVCDGRGNTDCRYGRPSSGIWALALAIGGVAQNGIVLVCVVGSLYYLVRSVVGVPRYFAWIDRRDAKKERKKKVIPLPRIGPPRE